MKSLGLYRELLRYGQNLKFTDKKYYFSKIRSEFEKNRNLANEKEILFRQGQAKAFLKNKALL